MKNFLPPLLLLFLYSCFPSFSPQQYVKEKRKIGKSLVVWIGLKGIIDQRFSDHIYIITGGDTLTVCQSDNMAKLDVSGDSIIIGFYGVPMCYGKKINISNRLSKYYIRTDTTFVRKDE